MGLDDDALADSGWLGPEAAFGAGLDPPDFGTSAAVGNTGVLGTGTSTAVGDTGGLGTGTPAAGVERGGLAGDGRPDGRVRAGADALGTSGFGRAGRGSIGSGSSSASAPPLSHSERAAGTAFGTRARRGPVAAVRLGRSSNTRPNPPMRSLMRLWRTPISTVTPAPTSTMRVPPINEARSSSPPMKWKSSDATRSPTKLSTLPRSPVTDAATHKVTPATMRTTYRLA
jgi:hypothetical protein